MAPYCSIRRRAYSAKYVGFVAPSTWNRSQSGSSGRSPGSGPKKPLGAVSAPTTSATSHRPGLDLGARPGRSPPRPTRTRRSSLDTGTPRQPSACANVEPGDVARVAVAHRVAGGEEADVGPLEAGVGQRGARRDHAVLDEVAAPLAPRVHARAEDDDRRRLLTSGHQASTSTRCGRRRRPRRAARRRAPSPARRAAPPTSVPRASWPSTIICSVGELDGGDAVRLERLARRVRRRRRVPVVGERPQRAARRQLDVVEVGRAARRVAAERVLLREEGGAARAGSAHRAGGLPSASSVNSPRSRAPRPCSRLVARSSSAPPRSSASRLSTNAWRSSSESPQRLSSNVKPCSKR